MSGATTTPFFSFSDGATRRGAKINFSKGQGSGEYLLLIAVAFIIVLIAVALLGGFGSPRSESAQYWLSSGSLSITEQVQTGTTLYLTFKNNEPNWLSIDALNVGGVIVTPREIVNAGQSRTVSIPGMPPCSRNIDSYEYSLTINYSSNDLPGQTKRGEKPLVGQCQLS